MFGQGSRDVGIGDLIAVRGAQDTWPVGAAPGRLGTVPRRMGAMMPRAWRPAASARVRPRSR